MKTLAVFCGSSPGRDHRYVAAARELGGLLARRGITLVFGGGKVGIMGALADATLEAGGRVVGVIPKFLVDQEHAHPGVSAMRVVETMHERKAAIAEAAEAFVALPGGFGTLEELVEVLTWAQLGLHTRPIGVWNVAGFFDDLLKWFDHVVAQRFAAPADRERLVVEARADLLLDRLEAASGGPSPRGDLERT